MLHDWGGERKSLKDLEELGMFWSSDCPIDDRLTITKDASKHSLKFENTNQWFVRYLITDQLTKQTQDTQTHNGDYY